MDDNLDSEKNNIDDIDVYVIDDDEREEEEEEEDVVVILILFNDKYNNTIKYKMYSDVR